MKRLSVGILSAAALAGLAGSTVAYAWGSAGTDGTAAVSRPAAQEQARPPARVVRPGAHVRWAPCVAPAHLERGVCVTDVVRTVVVPSSAAPAAPSAGSAAPAAGSGAGPRGPSSDAAEPGDDRDGDHADEPGDEPGEDHEEPGDDVAHRAVAPRIR